MLLRSSSAPLLNSSWIHPVSACSSAPAYSAAAACCCCGCSSSSLSPPPPSCCNNSSAHGHGHPPPAPDNKEQIVHLCSTLFPRTNSLLSLASNSNSKSKANPSSPDHPQTPILPKCCRSPKTQLITNYHHHRQFLLPAGNESPGPVSEPQTASSSSSLDRLFSSSGLDAAVLEVVGGNSGQAVEEYNDNVRTTQEEPKGDGDGGGDEGGRIGFGGEGCRRSRSRSDGPDEPDEHTEAYYQRLIEADPGNPLLLTNYAKFLKEVQGDIAKAEEYCERAILVNPEDPVLLSLYADIIWTSKRDTHRAESYFDQAVKYSPSDCYIMASYAKFLWDTEEQGEDQGGGEEENQNRNDANTNTNSLAFAWTGSSHTHPISATS